MRPLVAYGAADAGADVSAGTDTDAGVGASDDDGENYRTSSSGGAPREGETPPRGDSLCRSPRFAGMSILKSRAAVQSRTSLSISSLERSCC